MGVAMRRRQIRFSLSLEDKRMLAAMKRHLARNSSAAKRTRRNAFFRMHKPISFRTRNNFNVKIVRDGFFNVYKEQKESPARALVVVLVNGEKLFFYRIKNIL